ncbi:MAG: aldehyde dehydrogenase family protein [Elusimicrobia bacterium]|nr:aldehyde dehydrogenase family protein [Elusimicrobiota bacterium]
MTATAAPDQSLHPGVIEFLSGKSKKFLINGRWQEAQSGKAFPVHNPATAEVISHAAEGDRADIDQAVAAARRALEDGSWPKMTPADRSKLLHKIADLVESHADELAQLETLNNGKTIRESRKGDLPLAVDLLRYFAGWATKIHGETIPVSVPYAPGTKFFHYTTREPIGVVGAIIPWNFPLLMAVERLAPILACGNTMVLKPAEQTPLTALRLGELLIEAGLPPGVVNIVSGFGPTAGAALSAHPDVDKVTFTGSTEVGRDIVRASAGNLKRVSLELGGKSPNIVFADADLEAAAKGIFMGIFYNQGQCCSAGSRVYVERSKFDELLTALTKRAQTVRQGPGLDPNTQMGPVVSQEQMERVLDYAASGKREGAKLLCGGQRLGGALAKGYFVGPTVFSDVRDQMKIAQEEIFGPVVAVMPFDSADEMAARANGTSYGLVAGVWTSNVKRAFQMAQKIKAGTIWINCYHFVDSASPWGGYKQSGYGREKGPYAIEQYTQVKSVWVDLN